MFKSKGKQVGAADAIEQLFKLLRPGVLLTCASLVCSENNAVAFMGGGACPQLVKSENKLSATPRVKAKGNTKVDELDVECIELFLHARLLSHTICLVIFHCFGDIALV